MNCLGSADSPGRVPRLRSHDGAVPVNIVTQDGFLWKENIKDRSLIYGFGKVLNYKYVKV